MKTQKAILGVLASALFSLLIGAATGLPALAVFAAIFALSFFVSRPEASLLTAIDIADLATACGDYYRENRNILTSELLLDPAVTDKFTVYDNVTDELPLPKMEIGNILQPGVVKTFVPTADALAFDARILKVRDVKFDLQLVPSVLHKQWLGYNATKRRSDGSKDPFELPFEAFIMNKISEAARNQLYLQAMFNGSYNAAGTTPVATMTGINTLITNLIASTDIVPVSVADPTSTTVIDIVEAVYDGLGEAYKGVPTEMKVSPTVYDWYTRRYRALHGPNNNYEGMKMGRTLIDGTMCELVREPGMGTSLRMIATRKENLAYGCDTFATATMDIQKFDRTLKVLGDFKAGVELHQLGTAGNLAISVNELVSDGLV
ncbi:hypothetical protein V8V91_08590 [Algoriphagus halophilus]|uniref:hypothetical protein n=1 Tax=Algoriphagus halophilus TaxID=226505 RepID=UPI0035900469